MPGNAPNETTQWEERQWIGRQIGNCTVMGILGKGGTATVFKVLDAESKQQRALKMTSHEPTEHEIHRFKREFRVMSRLAHPNLITVHRYGLDQARPYFVMELVEGRDLRTWLRADADRPNFHRRISEMFVQVCRALAYIHDRNIVHRDLKPGNILVTHVGHVKVMDFGIAYELEGALQSSRSSKLMGTLAYVSPEQATGRRVDGRADLYSVGIMLYELLTGHKPFKGTSVSQMVYKHLHEVPPAPKVVHPQIPTALSDLAMALISKRPHDRPSSAQHMLSLLEAWLTEGMYTPRAVQVADVPTDRLPLNESRFVGRLKLLEALRIRCEWLRSGQGGFVLIVGEGGVGRSRALEEIRRLEALETSYVFSTRCLAAATSSYHGFKDIIRAVVSVGGAGSSIVAELTPPQIALLGAAFPELKPLLGLRSPSNDEAPDEVPNWLSLFTAIRALFERLTEQGPVVLLFDDVDNADESTLTLLQALLRTSVAGARARRLLVVATLRPENLPKARLDRTVGEVSRLGAGPLLLDSEMEYGARSDVLPSTSRGGGPAPSNVAERLGAILEMVGYREPPAVVRLSHLAKEQVEEMASSMLGPTEDPASLATYLWQQCEGNPSGVEALVRALVAQGILVNHETAGGGVWFLRKERLEAEAATLPLPPGLTGALKRRIETLERKDLAVLQILAALGESASHEVLTAVTELAEDVLLDFLDRMLKARLIVERVTGDQLWYDFFDTRIRQLILEDVPGQEQYLLHQRIGRRLAFLEQEALVGQVSHHLYEGRLYDEALPSLLSAGERLVAQRLYRLAMKPLARAEEILLKYRIPMEGRDDSELRLRLNHALGVALKGIGRTEEAFEHLSLALTAIEEQHRLQTESQIRTSLGQVLLERGEYRKARDHLELAVVRLREGELSYKMGESILGLGMLWRLQGPLTKGMAIFEEARDLSLELQDKSTLAGAVLGIGLCALERGQLAEASRRLTESIGLHRWLENRLAVLEGQAGLAECYRVVGRYEDALKVLEEASLSARELDLKGQRAALCALEGEVLLDLNALERAEQVLEEGLTISTLHSLLHHRATLLRVWGAWLEQKGRLQDALDAYRQGLRIAQGISATILTHRMLTQVARVQLAQGDVASARRLADRSVAELRLCGAMYGCVEAALVSARVVLAEKNLDAAQVILSEVIGRALEMEARDLGFRAIFELFRMPIRPEGYSITISLQRAVGVLQRLLEGIGPTWQASFSERPDVKLFRQVYAMTV